MQHRSDRLVFIFALLLSLQRLAVSVNIVKFSEILETGQFEDKLNLLAPKILLENHKGWIKEKNEVIINRECDRDLAVYERAIERQELWALRMFDSSSRIPPGLLQGNQADLGLFDECVNAKGISEGIEIYGQHCMYTIIPTSNNTHIFNPTLSICVPTNCTADDVYNLVNGTINHSKKLKEFNVSINDTFCTNKTSFVISTGLIIFLIVSVIKFNFLILCTYFDIRSRGKNTKEPVNDTLKTLIRFSLLKNVEAIFNTKNEDDKIPFINGLRCLCTLWIPFLHISFACTLTPNINGLDAMRWFNNWMTMFILNGVFSVDAFFVLSSFLMTYGFFKQRQKNKKFNILSHYLHRYIRLTPSLIYLIILTIYIVPYLANAPILRFINNIFVKSCVLSKFWTILLYVQNIVNKQNYCLLHLWSLSVDMQLFLLSPIILIPLHKRPKIGLSILASAFLAHLLYTGFLVAKNKYSAFFISRDINVPHSIQAFNDIYLSTSTRASPWFLGILLGYVITCVDTKPSNKVIVFGWILACISSFISFNAYKISMDLNYEYNAVVELLLSTFMRPLWSFFICWIIYASYHKRAGFVEKFLSLKIFLPISRISYCLYLVHCLFPIIRLSYLKTSNSFNEYSNLYFYVGDIILAMGFAILFNIFVEMPALILKDIIFKKNDKSSSTKNKIK